MTGGTYYLRLYGDSDDTYTYTASYLNRTDGLEIERNDQVANLVQLGETRFGQFYRKYPSTGYDQDLFYIPVTAPQTLLVDLAVGGTTSCCDGMYFELLNSQGDIYVGGYVPESQEESWPVAIYASDNYFLRVYGDTDDRYAFRFRLNDQLLPLEFEPNGSSQSATEIISGITYSGQFHTRYPGSDFDKDYFSFTTNSSGVISINTSVGGSTSCCDFLYVEVRDSVNNLLFADQIAEGASESNSIGIGSAGTYFVYLYGDTDDPYSFSVSGSPFLGAPQDAFISSIVENDGSLLVDGGVNFDGGSAITSYTATCGGVEATSSTLPISVTGLSNGISYSCTLTATNAVGTSEPSNPVEATPRGAPYNVSIDRIEAEDGALLVFISAQSGGGSNVSYSATCGGVTAQNSSSPVRVSGLLNDTTYQCTATVSSSLGSSGTSFPIAGTPGVIQTGLPIWLLYEAAKR